MTVVKAVLLVAIVLMQCCNSIVAARPLVEAPAVAVAGGDGTNWLGLVMQVLQGPGSNNGGWQAPGHP